MHLSSPAERSEGKGIHEWAQSLAMDSLPSHRARVRAVFAGNDSRVYDRVQTRPVFCLSSQVESGAK